MIPAAQLIFRARRYYSTCIYFALVGPAWGKSMARSLFLTAGRLCPRRCVVVVVFFFFFSREEGERIDATEYYFRRDVVWYLFDWTPEWVYIYAYYKVENQPAQLVNMLIK